MDADAQDATQREQVAAHEHGAVAQLVFDQAFLDHMAERNVSGKHRVTITEIMEVHEANPEYFTNEGSNRRAPLVMVGPTDSGRVLCIPLEPSYRHEEWRVVTAFEANRHDVERYKEAQDEGTD